MQETIMNEEAARSKYTLTIIYNIHTHSHMYTHVHIPCVHI